MGSKNISGERKALYYVGMALCVIGAIMFISTFFSNMSTSIGFYDFEKQTQSMMTRAISGMITIVIGTILMSIGARGAAGSGLILNPEKAREDLKPWSKMTGGIVNDAVEEIDAVKNLSMNKSSKEIIKVKCRDCGVLNDEDAKFCKGCGNNL